MQPVLVFQDIDSNALSTLLSTYKLHMTVVNDGLPIPGSFWGDAEAGLIADTLYIRPDTPVHSILHEACHYICMDAKRRAQLDTNAAGDYDEENAVCYLQILLAGHLPGVGKQRIMQDMDEWGYSFRLGSAANWFTQDAEDAKNWLIQEGIINDTDQPTFNLRY